MVLGRLGACGKIGRGTEDDVLAAGGVPRAAALEAVLRVDVVARKPSVECPVELGGTRRLGAEPECRACAVDVGARARFSMHPESFRTHVGSDIDIVAVTTPATARTSYAARVVLFESSLMTARVAAMPSSSSASVTTSGGA